MRIFISCLFIFFYISASAQNVKAFLDKGDRFFGRADYKSALTNYEAAEKFAPNDTKIKYRIGHVFLSLGNEVDALHYLEESYRLQPEVEHDVIYLLVIA